ncbi:MAG: S8 family serine peptidase [Clostridia bacterium]|nr:S8 family serine peptidase [Clostridia bacterium]
MNNKRNSALCIILALSFLFTGTGLFPLPAKADQTLYIEADPLLPRLSLFSAAEPSKDWAFTETEFSALPLFNLTGQGVRVGIIDSGISPHQDLPNQKIVAAASFVDGEPTTEDLFGHGTSVAAVVAGQSEAGVGAKGVAPDVEIVNARVLGSDGIMDISVLPYAIDYCVEQGCDVINMSLGTNVPGIDDYTKYKVLIDCRDAIQRAISAGCIVVAAAGNHGVDTGSIDFLVYPASLPDVISVGSTKEGYAHSAFSQENESVFVSAPGSKVYTATNSSEASYGFVSGTSVAAPFISGIAALIKEAYPNATQSQVKSFLMSAVIDLGNEGLDYSFGYGLINGKKLAKALRNSDFYAYFDENGTAYAANIGDDAEVLSYVSTYSGQRYTGTLDLSFKLKSMQKTELEMPGTGTVKRFFWLENSFSPLCGSLTKSNN